LPVTEPRTWVKGREGPKDPALPACWVTPQEPGESVVARAARFTRSIGGDGLVAGPHFGG